MPQFDPYWFASQVFWLAIIFTAFYWFMSRRILPRMAEVLDERERRIQGDLAKAAELKRDAEAAIATYEKALADARNEARDMMRATQDKAAQRSAQAQAELAAELAAQTSEAEARIARARDEALANVRVVAVDAAEAMVTRLVGGAVDRTAVESAVDASLSGRA